MNIKEALTSYFLKLRGLYKKMFNSLPTISWSPELNQQLFEGKPDEDGEIQWKTAEATQIIMDGLCKELQNFYSSYYYWELRGKYKGILFDFPPVPSLDAAKSIVSTAIHDGGYYFPKQETVLLATCTSSGNDDLLLFYRQNTGKLFIYDVDKRFVIPLEYSLTELLGSMEAVI